MTLADTPAHWAQVDPGPLTAEQIRSRVRRLEPESFVLLAGEEMNP